MNRKSFVILLMMLMGSTSIILGTDTYNDDSQKKNVALETKNTPWNESDRPRSLEMLTWVCYYENGRVYLNVPFEMGSVSLTVTNLVTGETWYYIQESGFGWTVLPTSQAQGNYRVVVETESYGEYIGYYNL